MRGFDGGLGTLAGQFALLSLAAFGGANTVLPEIHRQAVVVHHWMTDADFAALFALAWAAPGPNFLISTLVGWKAAGLVGALVATVAFCAPSCLLAYWISKVWDRYRDNPWRIALSLGVTPVTVGLVCASGYLLTLAADHDLRLLCVTGVTAGVAWLTKLNPLWCLGAAAGLGILGAFA